MTLSPAVRSITLVYAIGSLLLTAGCGGGAAGDAPAGQVAAGTVTVRSGAIEPSAVPPVAAVIVPAPAPAPAPVQAPPPVPVSAPAAPSPQLLNNGSFALGLGDWVVENAALADSTQRPGGQMLRVGGSATQLFAAGRVLAARSYTLEVKARVDATTTPAEISISFRRPLGAELIRQYTVPVAATRWQTYRIEFTAPPYALMGELTLRAGGAPLSVDTASLLERTAITQTEAVNGQAGSFVPAGYELAFNDEFNGRELNRSKWFTRYIYANGTLDRLNDEKQRYRDNGNHSVANGVLSLIARKVSADDPEGVDYESGMIRSDWTARHGYFEARVKMPGGIGLWPAFWLLSDAAASGQMSWPPEIDIFEFVNNGVEDRADMLHSSVVPLPGTTSPVSYADPMFNLEWTYYLAPFDFSAGWHTVGAKWDASSVTVYVDGRRIYTRGYEWNFPDGSAAGPAHILLNLAVGGAWAGRHGIADAALPQSLQIDWVRAYRKAS